MVAYIGFPVRAALIEYAPCSFTHMGHKVSSGLSLYFDNREERDHTLDLIYKSGLPQIEKRAHVIHMGNFDIAQHEAEMPLYTREVIHDLPRNDMQSVHCIYIELRGEETPGLQGQLITFLVKSGLMDQNLLEKSEIPCPAMLCTATAAHETGAAARTRHPA